MYFKKTIIILSLILFVFPFFVSGSNGGTSSPEGLLSGISGNCYSKGDCEFSDILIVAFNAFDFARDSVALPIAVVMVVVGGGMMIFSGGSKKMYEMGTKTLQTAVVGFLIVFGVSLILNSFLIALIGVPGLNWVKFIQSAFTGNLPF